MTLKSIIVFVFILFVSVSSHSQQSDTAYESDFQAVKEAVNRGGTGNKAKGLIKRYIKNYPDSEYVDDAYFFMSIYLLKKNDPKGGKKWLKKLIKEFPESERANVAKQHVVKIDSTIDELKKKDFNWYQKKKVHIDLGRALSKEYNSGSVAAFNKNSPVNTELAPDSKRSQPKSGISEPNSVLERGYPKSESFSSLDSGLGLRKYFSDQANHQPMSQDEMSKLILQLMDDVETLQKLSQKPLKDHNAATGRYSYQPLPSHTAQYVNDSLYGGLHKLLYRYARLISTIEHSEVTINFSAKVKGISSGGIGNDSLLVLHKKIFNFLSHNDWKKILNRCQKESSYTDVLCVDPYGNFDDGYISEYAFQGVFIDSYLSRLDTKAVSYIKSGKLDENSRDVLKALSSKSMEVMPKTNFYLNPKLIDDLVQKEMSWSSGALTSELIQKAYGGDADAMYEISTIYSSIEPKDSQSIAMKRATKWQRRAAVAGHIDAQYGLSKRQNKNSLRRVNLLALAAEKGHRESILELSSIYLDKEHSAFYQKKGLSLLEEAAKSGHAQSAYELGSIYYSGIKADQNSELAVKYFNMAAEQKHVPSLKSLGEIYSLGKGNVDKNVSLAIKFYERSVANGSKRTMIDLARLYVERGGAEDYSKAVKLCRNLINQKQPKFGGISDDAGQAHTLLAHMFEHGLGVEQSFENSFAFHFEVYESQPESAMELLRMFMIGRPFIEEKDFRAAMAMVNFTKDSTSEKRYDHGISVICSMRDWNGPDCDKIHPALKRFTDVAYRTHMYKLDKSKSHPDVDLDYLKIISDL